MFNNIDTQILIIVYNKIKRDKHMKRYTKIIDNKYIADKVEKTEEGFQGEAIEQLALFENMIENILLEQEELTKKMEELKDPQSGKVHWRAKEFMGKKMANQAILIALKYHGIEVE